jgi:hypothetical protein
MEGLDKTLQAIEQRNSERLQKSWKCERCKKEQEPPLPQDQNWFCPACLKIALKEAKDFRLSLVDGMMKSAGVPPLLSKYTKPLSTFDWIEDYGHLHSSKGLCLIGLSGVGKSVHAVLIMRRWLEAWAQQDGLQLSQPSGMWKFVGCAGLVMRIQDAWHSDEESAYKILKSIAEIPHLIIDDLGTEKPTDYVRQAIYFIINEREQWQRQTIITTNFRLEDIDRQYDSRISSRISGMCDVRELKGKDRRVEK